VSKPLGVVAAGHSATAEAGAEALRAGGNAVDAAISAALASFVCESPLTGFGAGGFMYIHEPGGKDGVVLDFFVAGGGSDGFERTEDLIPISVYFDETSQTFNAGAASCGVPGNAAGLALAAERYGSMPLSELVKPGIALGRDGVVINEQQGYILEILEAILTMTPESAALYAPDGNPLRTGDTFHYPDMSDALERFGAEGSEPFTSGEIAVKVAEWVRDHGGNLGIDDLRAYEPIVREPLRMSFRGAEVMMNPPSSSGGLLISYALGLLERLGPTSDAERLVAAMEASNSVRQDDFHQRLHQEGFAAEVLDPQALDAAVAKIESGEWVGGGGGAGGPDPDSDSLGSTTHITAVDAEGRCASVTCSNGTCSGIQVPGTGVHLNNMLGEEDLNPGGFHRIPPGQRVSSMMSPGAVLRDGELVLGIGSAGSNRIRSAVVQTVLRTIEDGMSAQSAIDAGRLHFEFGVVQAEPGVDAPALDRLEQRGVPVVRWKRRNLFFGGVQAVVRDPSTGALDGGGDPRRGGAVSQI
jgi:gamma-glutamyltranspeptidase/glutathione hydrolase